MDSGTEFQVDKAVVVKNTSQRGHHPSLLLTTHLIPQLTHPYLSFIRWPLHVLTVAKDRRVLGIGSGVFSRPEASCSPTELRHPLQDIPCPIQTSLSPWKCSPSIHIPFLHRAVSHHGAAHCALFGVVLTICTTHVCVMGPSLGGCGTPTKASSVGMLWS